MTCYFENTLAIEAKWLIDEHIISKRSLERYKSSGAIKQLRLGGNCRKALIEYESLPDQFKNKVEQKIGNPRQVQEYMHFRSFLKPDKDAVTFFGSTYKLQDGRYLPTQVAQEYCINAMFLNAIALTYNDTIAFRRAIGGRKKGVWLTLTKIINHLKAEFKHTLPSNELRLKDKFNKYQSDGYTSLIHRNYGNDYSRKVNEALEKLILSIYTMNNKPLATMVQAIYLEFLAGKIDIIDITTGEMFNRFDFYNDKDQPITISEGTVWNYINDIKNRAIVDSLRNDSHSFNNMHRPFFHRHKPEYALSKISLDDRDLPRKLTDGTRVKAYYAYDVASGVLIGTAYSRNKDTGLFIDCLRDMFRFLEQRNLNFPLELEVEHHIVNQFRDDLMKAGVVFPFIRFCNPGNSQEKHAERMIGVKKLGYEKRYQEGIGRFYSKLEANRPKINKEWNELGMQVIEKKYEYDRLVADDRWIIDKYNNDLHPNQKKFKGMTRMQVFMMKQNPDAATFDKAKVARYVGDKTQTSIMRNQYLFVQNGKFILPNIECLGRLKPNNYTVDAYYLPEIDGTINKVFIFQNDNYIAECGTIETFNTASAEHTDKDKETYTNQAKYVSQFDSMIKTGRKTKTAKLEIISAEKTIEIEPEIHTSTSVEAINWDSYFENDMSIEERAIKSM